MKNPLNFLVSNNYQHNIVIAFIAGVILVTGFEPLNFPLSILSFSLLLKLMDKCENIKQSFVIGWCFGFGFFIFSIYWFAFALLTDAEKFAWLIPFAVFGIAGILAIYTGITAIATNLFESKNYRILIFAIFWVIFEWLRGHLFTGFPWNLAGYAWSFSAYFYQIASIIGIYGLSLITVIIGCALYQRGIIPAIIMLLIIGGFGAYRLNNHQVSFHEGVNIRLVQPNISQSDKWIDSYQIFKQTKALSQQDNQDITHIIWPETGFTQVISPNSIIPKFLQKNIASDKILLIGALRDNGNPVNYKLWNSMFVIESEHISAYYDKFHLVPFGEYIPFRSLFPFISRIAYGIGDIAEGNGVKTIILESTPSFSPLICYEIIFPSKIVDEKNRPEWILNITNDGWFGISSGPYQHFAAAKFRAVEEGLPVVRAANTGISGVIDAYGVVMAKTSLGEKTYLDYQLPKAGNPTIYSKFDDWMVIFSIIFSFLIFALRNLVVI